ncbi:MAG: hypothetical protein LBS97_06160 [Treponema sp.]|nr:hypothetical protein [Treponema sp.]
MVSTNAEELLRNVSEGKVKGEKAVSTLFEAIYRYPKLFGYADFDEDSRSAFLLSVYPKLSRVVDFYNPSRSSFITYAVNSIRMYVKSWKRIAAKQKAAQDTLYFCYHCERETGTTLACAEEEPEYGLMRRPAFMVENLKLLRRSTDMLLVLALKCAAHLSEGQIDAVAFAAGVMPQVLHSHIDVIKKMLSHKFVMRQNLIEARNRSWFLKARCRLELERLRPGTTQYDVVEKQYIHQTRLLEIKNNVLKCKSFLVPSNDRIAAVLHLPVRQVTRLLGLAKERGLLQILEPHQGENMKQTEDSP